MLNKKNLTWEEKKLEEIYDKKEEKKDNINEIEDIFEDLVVYN